jgi:hypothetical protein
VALLRVLSLAQNESKTLKCVRPQDSKATKRYLSQFPRLVRMCARIPIVRKSGYSVVIERVPCHDGHPGCRD